MKIFNLIKNTLALAVVFVLIFGAGNIVRYFTKEESDVRYYQKTVADTTFVKVADLVTPTEFDTLNITNKLTAPTKAAGTNSTDVATTAFTKIDRYQFVVGTTANAPTAGDSIFSFSQLVGKSVKLIRNGSVQYLNTTATNAKNGFRYDNTIGYLVVKPVWASAELVQIELINTAMVDNTMPVTQNLFKYSEEIDNAVWNTAWTKTANQEVDLTGQTTLDMITMTATGTLRYYNLAAGLVVSPSTTYNLSFDCKRGTATALYFSVWDNSNDVLFVNKTSYFTQTSSTVQRVNLQFTTPSTCSNVNVYLLHDPGGSGGTVYLGRAQLQTINGNYVKTVANPKS